MQYELIRSPVAGERIMTSPDPSPNVSDQPIILFVANSIAAKQQTCDMARLHEAIRASKRELAARTNVEEVMQALILGAMLMTCSGFGQATLRHL